MTENGLQAQVQWKCNDVLFVVRYLVGIYVRTSLLRRFCKFIH